MDQGEPVETPVTRFLNSFNSLIDGSCLHPESNTAVFNPWIACMYGSVYVHGTTQRTF